MAPEQSGRSPAAELKPGESVVLEQTQLVQGLQEQLQRISTLDVRDVMAQLQQSSSLSQTLKNFRRENTQDLRNSADLKETYFGKIGSLKKLLEIGRAHV